MSRKRRSREDEIALEIGRLDDALDELGEQLVAVVPLADHQPALKLAQAKLRRDAALAIATLSARKASLLGLDAPAAKADDTAGAVKPGSIAELERKLELVGGYKP